MRYLAVVLSAVLVCSCTPSSPQLAAETPPAVPNSNTSRKQHEIHVSGLVEAVHSARVVAPQIVGQNNRMTLTRLIPNGSLVQEGDVIAEFDPLEQMDAARTARAKYEDLSHQVDQKAAQNRADQEKRRSDLRQAEADLSKALLEVSKAEILAEIAKQQNQIKADRGRLHIESLAKSHAFRDKVDAAALRVLELQRDRQKVALERAQSNIEIMQARAPLGGMVAHSIQYRSGSMTHVQEGDQLYRGNALVSIFDRPGSAG
jgi:HlyD family secretion protein